MATDESPEDTTPERPLTVDVSCELEIYFAFPRPATVL